MSVVFNPFSSNFDFTGGASTLYLPTVQSESDLPSGDQDGAVRVVRDTDRLYAYDLATDTWTDSGVTVAAFSSTADAKGVTVSVVADGSNPKVLRPTLVLHAADATHPGALTTTSQAISGNKDFQNDVLVEGQIKSNTIDTLNLGDTLGIGIANASTINIGRSGSTVNIIGTTNNVNVTNLNVTDKNITVNKNGASGSGSDAGIEVEENASITGYSKVSADRVSWRFKAPGTSGEFFLAPNNNGFSQVLAAATLTSNQVYTLPDASGNVVLDSATQTLTNKTINAASNTITNISNAEIKASAGIDATKIGSGTVDNTELGYLDGVTSSIQTQLNAKEPTITTLPIIKGGTNSGSTLNNNRIMESNGGSIVERAALTNGQIIIGSTSANPVNGTLTAGTGVSITNGAGSITVANSAIITGDIFTPTSFTGTQSVAVTTDVTGLAFANASVRSFVAEINILVSATSSLYQHVTIRGIQRASDWVISQESLGDNAAIGFSITTAGQIQYISSTYAGFSSLTMKFTAKVIPV